MGDHHQSELKTMTLSTDRRSLFKLSLAGAASLAMPQIMVRAAHADVAQAGTEAPAFHRFKLGTFEVTTISDGIRVGDGPYPTFGANQQPEAVSELMAANFLPADRFANGFTPTLIHTGKDLVLFDTGLGEGARGGGLGKMRERLQASGYSPDDVTVVVITHFHPDHVGGLTEAGKPSFPKARYVMGKVEHDFWTAPERLSGPTAQVATLTKTKVAPLAKDATLIGDGEEVLPGITAMAAHGHTPGHMIFHVESAGKRLVLTADTANHYVASLQRPDWHVAFDLDKEQAAQSRGKVFDMIAADRVPFIGYHMPYPSLGYVEKMDVGYRYVPASYQFDL
ncbi:MBL fold metallo-hydrolase [Rhizobium sp. BK602]|uniref:MBL fold metallo-hydrolase n=1 Tax=Rhizobium sp. BK602 TaxID=2586986 RepID=UPI00185BCD43|nr:MBL fold metallo-hydrolase [Rhizobium sp. BK602]MBB3610375.1 glyoxylase-like metal-dependent hydrolase (beta-lactamase superfamily II) [Rhizobium sp. BK602]